MNMSELVSKFDETHTYVGERFLEKYLPGVDSIMDRIFTGIYCVELQFINDPTLDEHDGPSKLEALTALTEWMLAVIPLPPVVRAFLAPILETSIPLLISAAVNFLNDLLGNNSLEQGEGKKSILDLIPAKDSQPDSLVRDWVLETAEALEVPDKAADVS